MLRQPSSLPHLNPQVLSALPSKSTHSQTLLTTLLPPPWAQLALPFLSYGSACCPTSPCSHSCFPAVPSPPTNQKSPLETSAPCIPLPQPPRDFPAHLPQNPQPLPRMSLTDLALLPPAHQPPCLLIVLITCTFPASGPLHIPLPLLGIVCQIETFASHSAD